MAFYLGDILCEMGTETRRSRLRSDRSDSAHWDLELGEEEDQGEVTLLKSRDPHLTGREKESAMVQTLRMSPDFTWSSGYNMLWPYDIPVNAGQSNK